MTTADRIKLLRESLGLTQEQLASRMGYTGKSSISKIESSGDNVTLKKISKLAPILHTSEAFLMGWTNNPDPKYPSSTEFSVELINNVYNNVNNSVMKAFHPENDTKEGSNTNPQLEEWNDFFYELSDEQKDEAIEFLRLYVGARPDVRDQIVHLLVSLAQ